MKSDDKSQEIRNRCLYWTFPFKIIFSLGQFQYYTGPVWLNELDRWI